MVSPCVNALRHIATTMKDMLRTDIGMRHAPADLTKDITILMDSLSEHKVYHLMKGRVLDNDDFPVPDVVSVGLQQLTDSSSNPLTEYNKAFKRLQTRRSTNPIVESEPLSQTTPVIARHQPEIIPNSCVVPPIAVLDNAPEVINLDGVDSEGEGEGGEEVDCEDSMLELDDGDVTLERLGIEDVAFDMDTGGSMDAEDDGEYLEGDWEEEAPEIELSSVFDDVY